MSASIAQKSAREWFLFTIGVKKAEDIITWADSIIIDDDKPDARIIDLSTTSPERTDIFVAELDRLKEGGDIWKAIGEGLDDVHDFVVAHPDQAERVSKALDSIASWYSKDMPAEFSFISRFDDAFYLAKDGIYGGTDAVLADFISHLSRYKK